MTRELRQLIDRALPKHELRLKRAPLVRKIAQDIQDWHTVEPEISPHADKIRAATAIATKAAHAIEKANAALKRLGVEQDLASAVAQRGRLIGETNPDRIPIRGHTALLDLFITTRDTARQLETWQRANAANKGRPAVFSAVLTKKLQFLLGKKHGAGYSDNEVNDFLSEVSGQLGIPRLSGDTIKKRRTRAKKK